MIQTVVRAGLVVASMRVSAAMLAVGALAAMSPSDTQPRASHDGARALPNTKSVIGRPPSKGCSAVNYRKFDFWIGDWDVYVNDKVAGHNLVTLEQDGCLLIEHWTSNGDGQTGTSFNYFDIRDQKWHQLYLDNSGNAGAFPAMAGDLVDGRMVLMTDSGRTPWSRWTWYVMAPGKVKQMAESSADRGATWRTTWNSVYVRKSTP